MKKASDVTQVALEEKMTCPKSQMIPGLVRPAFFSQTTLCTLIDELAWPEGFCVTTGAKNVFQGPPRITGGKLTPRISAEMCKHISCSGVEGIEEDTVDSRMSSAFLLQDLQQRGEPRHTQGAQTHRRETKIHK